MTNNNYSSKAEYYLFKHGYVLPEQDFLKLKQELTFIINQVIEAEKEYHASICEDLFSSDGGWCAKAIRDPSILDHSKHYFDTERNK